MKKDSTHRTPNYAGWAGLEGIDLKKDIEQLEHIEHDIEKIKIALYHEKRVLNHAYHHEEEEPQEKSNEKIQMKLYDLHNEIVNKIVMFCKENNIDADRFEIVGDFLGGSVDEGCWHSDTDSALCLFDKNDNVLFESV